MVHAIQFVVVALTMTLQVSDVVNDARWTVRSSNPMVVHGDNEKLCVDGAAVPTTETVRLTVTYPDAVTVIVIEPLGIPLME